MPHDKEKSGFTMNRLAAIIIILFLALSVPCLAEDRNWDGTPKTEVKKDRPLNRGSDFLIVTGLFALATVYDVEATMHAGRHGAREGNGWARSFVEKGRGETYACAGGVGLVTMGISYALFKSKDPETQRKWIILPIIGIAGHAIGGTLNLAWRF